MIFTLNFYEYLLTVCKYVLNSVVKISLMFAQYFEYYAIVLRGPFFVDTLLYRLLVYIESFPTYPFFFTFFLLIFSFDSRPTPLLGRRS